MIELIMGSFGQSLFRCVGQSTVRCGCSSQNPAEILALASSSRDALARARPVGEPRVACAIGQAVEGRVAAEAKIRKPWRADRPAASLLVQLEQRAALPALDRFVVGRRPWLAVQCLEHLILQPWTPWHGFRANSLGGILSRASRLAASLPRQIEAVELADDGVAAYPDLVGDLTAGPPGFKAAFQAFKAFFGPGGCVGGHVMLASSRACRCRGATAARP